MSDGPPQPRPSFMDGWYHNLVFVLASLSLLPVLGCAIGWALRQDGKDVDRFLTELRLAGVVVHAWSGWLAWRGSVAFGAVIVEVEQQSRTIDDEGFTEKQLYVRAPLAPDAVAGGYRGEMALEPPTPEMVCSLERLSDRHTIWRDQGHLHLALAGCVHSGATVLQAARIAAALAPRWATPAGDAPRLGLNAGQPGVMVAAVLLAAALWCAAFGAIVNW